MNTKWPGGNTTNGFTIGNFNEKVNQS